MLRLSRPVSGFLACAAMASAAIGTGPARSGPATVPPVFTGTYALRFCHGPCTARVAPFRTGTLVLLDRPVRDRRGRALRLHLEPGPVNGCFILHEAGEKPRRGWLAWRPQRGRADAIAFQLDRSPDGGYAVELRLAASGLAGRGMAWGGAMGTPVAGASPAPVEGIVARRIGDADLTRCPGQASG
jgi:hypothetical protein